MKYFLPLLLLSFSASAGMFCSGTDGEVNRFNLSFTVPFEWESGEVMTLSDYHEWVGIRIYNELDEVYTFSYFAVTGEVMTIPVWTRCDINRLRLTLTDVEGRESIYSNEVIIDYTAPKTGTIECVPI